MAQPSLGTRDEDRPSNERLFVLLGAITVVGGLSWVVLTPLEVATSGATEYFVAYLTEPFVGLLGIAGSYGLARRQENAVGHRGRLGHLLLITGFLLVGFPAALDSIVWMPAMIFFLGQTDFILISTLAGLVLVYTGSALVGADARSKGTATRLVTGTLMLAPVLAVIATALAYVTSTATWMSTAVIGPAGLVLATIGYHMLTLARPRWRNKEGNSGSTE